MRRFLLIIGCLTFLISCQSKEEIKQKDATESAHLTIKLGSKAFTEQYLLMKMTALLLMEEGFDIDEMRFLDSPSIRDAFENKVIDLYWEYTNTAKTIYHKSGPGYDSLKAYESVKKEDEKNDIIWLEKSDFNSSWGLIMKESFAKQHQLDSVSDLVTYMSNQEHPSLKMATNDEYLIREDGLSHLEDVYQFSVNKDQLLAVDSELLSLAVKESRVQVAVGMITDSRIKDYHLIVLEDNRKAFPPYDAAPVLQRKMIEQYPEIQEPLEKLSASITNEEMIGLNYRVDVLHQDVGKVAKAFLQDQGLLRVE